MQKSVKAKIFLEEDVYVRVKKKKKLQRPKNFSRPTNNTPHGV